MAVERIVAGDGLSESADVVTENVEALRGLFPEAFTEDGIDFGVLKQLLGGKVAERPEKFGLNWHGKRDARRIALTPSTGTLRPCPEESVDWDATQNLMIEGDNLEVLKLLQKSYAGRVKLIYIDPPYNTGKDFVYRDDFRDNIRNYLELTGQVDGEGRKLSTNVETSGRFHTDWLNMMYPRLKLARNLLRDDGVIFISIDDNELENLLAVCNEILGEENHIATIQVKSRASVSNDKILSTSHNGLLVYARTVRSVYEQRFGFGLDPDLEGFDREDERGWFKLAPVDGPGGAAKGNPFYTFKGVEGYWRYSEETMRKLFDEGRVIKVGSGLQQKRYLHEVGESRKTATTWWAEGFLTSTASSRLKSLMGGEAFTNPKPVELVERMLELWARSEDDVVLDFFAGSGTAGHAVFARGATGLAAPRFVLVQLPERLDDDEPQHIAAAEYCEAHGLEPLLTELTKERLRRAGVKVKEEHPDWDGDVGFRVFKLDSSNIRAWNPETDDLDESLLTSLEHVVEGRTDQDLLYEVLLKLGLDLCVPIEHKAIDGVEVSSVGGGVLLTCLIESLDGDAVESVGVGMVEWLSELEPAGDVTVVFRDSAFADDVAKTNMAAILEQGGVTTIRSI